MPFDSKTLTVKNEVYSIYQIKKTIIRAQYILFTRLATSLVSLKINAGAEVSVGVINSFDWNVEVAWLVLDRRLSL